MLEVKGSLLAANEGGGRKGQPWIRLLMVGEELGTYFSTLMLGEEELYWWNGGWVVQEFEGAMTILSFQG